MDDVSLRARIGAMPKIKASLFLLVALAAINGGASCPATRPNSDRGLIAQGQDAMPGAWERFVAALRDNQEVAAAKIAESEPEPTFLELDRWLRLEHRTRERGIAAMLASSQRRQWTLDILTSVARDLHALFNYSNEHMGDDSVDFTLGFLVEELASQYLRSIKDEGRLDEEIADAFAEVACDTSYRLSTAKRAGEVTGTAGSERHAFLLYSALRKDQYEERARSLARIPSLVTLVLLMRADGDPLVRELPWPLTQFIAAVCGDLRDENPRFDGLEQETRLRWYQYWLSSAQQYLYIEMRDPSEHTFRYQVRVQTDWQSRGVVPRMIWPDDPAYGSPSFPTWRFEDWDQHKDKYPYYRWNTMDEAVQAGHIAP